MDDRKPKPMLFRNTAILHAAIRAIIGGGQGAGIPTARLDQPRGGFYQPPPSLAGEVSGECIVPKRGVPYISPILERFEHLDDQVVAPKPMADHIIQRAGQKLTDLKLMAVPPEHEHAPAPKKFNVVGSTCYVLEQDYPKLQQALERQIAKRTPASGSAE